MRTYTKSERTGADDLVRGRHITGSGRFLHDQGDFDSPLVLVENKTRKNSYRLTQAAWKKHNKLAQARGLIPVFRVDIPKQHTSACLTLDDWVELGGEPPARQKKCTPTTLKICAAEDPVSYEIWGSKLILVEWRRLSAVHNKHYRTETGEDPHG